MSIQILVVGRNEEIVETLLRLINKHSDWIGKGCVRDSDALSLFADSNYDIVLLSGGINPQEEHQLCSYFSGRKPAIAIIQHFGGGSGLLYSEIQQSLERTSTHEDEMVSRKAPTTA